jgi:hypothetical protein
VLVQPVPYFIPEHAADPSSRAAGEELWVEVTIPGHGTTPDPARGERRIWPTDTARMALISGPKTDEAKSIGRQIEHARQYALKKGWIVAE